MTPFKILIRKMVRSRTKIVALETENRLTYKEYKTKYSLHDVASLWG